MLYPPPRCFECRNFIKPPKFIGESGKCTEFPNDIPRSIFFECGKCTKFSPLEGKESKKKELYDRWTVCPIFTDEIVDNGTHERILFCNIAWMKYYQGTCDEDIPIYGGSSVEETQSANEDLNFFPIIIDTPEEGEKIFVLGSFETKTTKGDTVNQVHIEKIHGCAGLKKEDYADGVLVIWCAKSPYGGSSVVGWYKNATVNRYYEAIEIDEEDGTSFIRGFNISALASDAVLIPEKNRNKHIWNAPRKNSKTGTPYGFFKANAWYALEPEAKGYIKRLVDNINAYDGENVMKTR